MRIEYTGAWYHIMNRGRRGDNVFEGKEDCEIFVALLKEAAELWTSESVLIGVFPVSLCDMTGRAGYNQSSIPIIKKEDDRWYPENKYPTNPGRRQAKVHDLVCNPKIQNPYTR